MRKVSAESLESLTKMGAEKQSEGLTKAINNHIHLPANNVKIKPIVNEDENDDNEHHLDVFFDENHCF